METILLLVVVAVWLGSQIWFLYALEQRRPWATRRAETLALLGRASHGVMHNLRETAPHERSDTASREHDPTDQPICRSDVWTVWL